MGDEKKSNGGAEALPQLVDEFELTFKIALRAHENEVGFFIDLDLHGGRLPYEADAQVGALGALFDNVEQVHEWVRRTGETFFDTSKLPGAVADALKVWFTTAASLALIEAGAAPYTVEQLAESQNQAAALFLRQRLGLPVAASWTKWTQLQLSSAIFAAMLALYRRAKSPTYALVAREMQKYYPGRPPTTGEALRKVVTEMGVDWITLKGKAEKKGRGKKRSK